MMKYYLSSQSGRKGSGPPRSSGGLAVGTLKPHISLYVTLVFKAIFLLTLFWGFAKKVRRGVGTKPHGLDLDLLFYVQVQGGQCPPYKTLQKSSVKRIVTSL